MAFRKLLQSLNWSIWMLSNRAHEEMDEMPNVRNNDFCFHELELDNLNWFNRNLWKSEHLIQNLNEKDIPLIEDGENISVTNENKELFIEKVVRYRLVIRIKEQTNAFVTGFHSLISKEELKMFNPSELDLIICGVPIIDVRDMMQFSKYEYPFSVDHPVVQRFFAVIRHWTGDDLAKLLLFVTGSSQVPIGGFKTLKEMGRPFTLAPGGDHDRLPAAHTCINTLDLPEYRSENELNEKLHLAINECNSFGFV